MSPMSWVGVAFILFGVFLYFSDMDIDLDVYPAVDVPGIGGGICAIIGTLLLFDDLRIGAGLSLAILLLVTARLVVRYRVTRFRRYPGRTEALVGETGYTTTPLEPRGSVQMASELWSAVSDSGESIEQGVEVMVVDVDGLTLKVFKPDLG